MTVENTAVKWGVTARRVRELCESGYVIGAVKANGAWSVPETSPKPVDSRRYRYGGIPESMQADFMQMEALKAELAAMRPLTDGEKRALRENFLIDYTYHSNAIEGNTLTISETAMVLGGMTIGEKPLKDHLEAIGHRDAFLYLEESLKEGVEITETFIKELHYLVLNFSREDRGRYRRVPVFITGADHTPPQPFMVGPMMEDWVREIAKSKLNALVAAAKFHILFEAIHPFIDGNGRTGRLLANFMLMRGGYLPISIKYENRRAYYEAFGAYHRDHDDGVEMIRIFIASERARLEEYLGILRQVQT